MISPVNCPVIKLDSRIEVFTEPPGLYLKSRIKLLILLDLKLKKH